MLDITLPASASFTHTLPLQYDNCLVHVYGKEGKDSGSTIQGENFAVFIISFITLCNCIACELHVEKVVGPSSIVRLDAKSAETGTTSFLMMSDCCVAV